MKGKVVEAGGGRIGAGGVCDAFGFALVSVGYFFFSVVADFVWDFLGFSIFEYCIYRFFVILLLRIFVSIF